ncbi:hypothetical protein [Aquimarina algiphila]|uniref:hypothetical protein n=1 Tax=Aquimarina algiphila TaxID=2047982 RepID=UPI00143059F4|nr:hypothetical protein [Aquimarina algiphila]
MKKENYIEKDKTITTAFVLITGIGIIGLLAIAFDNVNVLWTLNIVPSCVQIINRKNN